MTLLLRVLLILLAIVLFFFGLFAVDQTQVSLAFLDWRTPEWSLFWWLLLAFGIGLATGATAMALATVRRSFENRRLRRELERNTSELRQLRSATLQD